VPVDIDIAHVARLARLELTPEEMETYRSQLGVILEHAARVQALEGEPEVGSVHGLGIEGVFRDDEVAASLDRDEVLAAAPESRDGFFVVPPALEQ
jgi:aspartyl-tRNA(Asn)/glutamyl-tRNA(Gln) amidotransferase subunit C